MKQFVILSKLLLLLDFYFLFFMEFGVPCHALMFVVDVLGILDCAGRFGLCGGGARDQICGAVAVELGGMLQGLGEHGATRFHFVAGLRPHVGLAQALGRQWSEIANDFTWARARAGRYSHFEGGGRGWLMGGATKLPLGDLVDAHV